MQLIFLGTSSGAPTRMRNLSGLALSRHNRRDWLLIDCGEATQHRLLCTPLSPLRLQAVLITHIHGDHCYGLPGLLASAQLSGRTEPLTLVGPAALWTYVQGVIETTALRLDYPLHFVDVMTVQGSLRLGAFRVSAWPLSHRVPSYAYRFDEVEVPRRLLTDRLERDGIPRGPLWGGLQRGESVLSASGERLCSDAYTVPAWRARRLVIGGDNDSPELLREACQDIDLLVHEATYDETVLARVGPEPMHSSAARVAAFAEALRLPHLILTHFSPRYQQGGGRGLPLALLEQEARARYRGDLWLAQDYDRFHLDRQGELQRSSLTP